MVRQDLLSLKQNLLSPDLLAANTQNAPKGACLTDNKWHRIRTLFQHYWIQVYSSLRRGIPLKELVVTQFPFAFPDLLKPPGLHLEITNFCNLSCTYCTCADKPREQGMMTRETFNKLINHLRDFSINRIYIVGLGEATLHPNFCQYLKELRQVTRYISLTSNFNRITDEVLDAILTSSVDLLNISVDGFDQKSYEEKRLRGNYQALIENLDRLKERKKVLKSRTIVNIRLMIPPSQLHLTKTIQDLWKPYADEVSLQYLVDISGKGGDVFSLKKDKDYYPKCSLLFKQLDLYWNGDVPLCTYTYLRDVKPYKNMLGNINNQSLRDLWKSNLKVQYRNAHRSRNKELMPQCAGCGGC